MTDEWRKAVEQVTENMRRVAEERKYRGMGFITSDEDTSDAQLGLLGPATKTQARIQKLMGHDRRHTELRRNYDIPNETRLTRLSVDEEDAPSSHRKTVLRTNIRVTGTPASFLCCHEIFLQNLEQKF